MTLLLSHIAESSGLGGVVGGEAGCWCKKSNSRCPFWHVYWAASYTFRQSGERVRNGNREGDWGRERIKAWGTESKKPWGGRSDKRGKTLWSEENEPMERWKEASRLRKRIWERKQKEIRLSEVKTKCEEEVEKACMTFLICSSSFNGICSRQNSLPAFIFQTNANYKVCSKNTSLSKWPLKMPKTRHRVSGLLRENSRRAAPAWPILLPAVNNFLHRFTCAFITSFTFAFFFNLKKQHPLNPT